jgi:hypothetical protein
MMDRIGPNMRQGVLPQERFFRLQISPPAQVGYHDIWNQGANSLYIRVASNALLVMNV